MELVLIVTEFAHVAMRAVMIRMVTQHRLITFLGLIVSMLPLEAYAAAVKSDRIVRLGGQGFSIALLGFTKTPLIPQGIGQIDARVGIIRLNDQGLFKCRRCLRRGFQRQEGSAQVIVKHGIAGIVFQCPFITVKGRFMALTLAIGIA